jgi:predicted HAD superfamily Cof-like phosphohydrolase
MPKKDSVAECLEFFTKAYPQSTPKNFRTQLGVHFEEFAEMIAALEPASEEDKMLLHFIGEGIKGTANHLKASDGVIGLKDRVEFLDAVCDQMVTAVGLGRHANMDVVGGFKEVNRSNLSKFDDNGDPIFDNNLKVMKGPNYTKPDLKTFV